MGEVNCTRTCNYSDNVFRTCQIDTGILVHKADGELCISTLHRAAPVNRNPRNQVQVGDRAHRAVIAVPAIDTSRDHTRKGSRDIRTHAIRARFKWQENRVRTHPQSEPLVVLIDGV